MGDTKCQEKKGLVGGLVGGVVGGVGGILGGGDSDGEAGPNGYQLPNKAIYQVRHTTGCGGCAPVSYMPGLECAAWSWFFVCIANCMRAPEVCSRCTWVLMWAVRHARPMPDPSDRLPLDVLRPPQDGCYKLGGGHNARLPVPTFGRPVKVRNAGSA